MSTPENTPFPRGRGSFRRGRSSSRTRGGGRNYGSSRVQQEQIAKDQAIAKNLEDNIIRSQNTAKPSQPQISEYIEQGKTLVSKFFKGFEQEKRGNIEVTLDDSLPERISEVYFDRLMSHSEDKFRTINDQGQRRQKEKRLIKRFTAGITLATAIKLYKSSTELEKNSNFSLNILNTSTISVPEKAAVMINQLGKTDLRDDNRIRIINQNMACKRMMIKSLCRFMDANTLESFCSNMTNSGVQPGHLYGYVFSDNFQYMIDNSLKSLQLLKEYGKQFFIDKAKLNYAVQVNSVSRSQNPINPINVTFNIRLPEFDFNNVTVASVTQYLNNPLFSVAANRHFDFQDNNAVVNVVCALVFQIAKADWIRNPNRTMAALDNQFNNTFIAQATFLNVMNHAGIWNINNWIDDSDINELVADQLHKWNTTDVTELRNVFKFKQIVFSEYGTDSQMVEIPQSAIDIESKFGSIERYSVKKKPISKVGLKISETGAIFGVMGRFIRKMRMTSDFNVVHDSNNRNILREFLKSDFI